MEVQSLRMQTIAVKSGAAQATPAAPFPTAMNGQFIVAENEELSNRPSQKNKEMCN